MAQVDDSNAFNRKDENNNNKNMCVTFDMGRRQWKSTLSEWRVMFIVCLKQEMAKSISLACRPNRMPEAETQPSYQDLLFYPYRYDAFFFIRAVFEYYLTQISQDHFENE